MTPISTEQPSAATPTPAPTDANMQGKLPFIPAGLTAAELNQLKPLPAPPAFSARPTPWDLLKALRRRWLLATILGIVCAVPVGVVAWIVTPSPKHTARSIVKFSDNRIFFTLPDNRDFTHNYREFQVSQVALIKSHKLLNRVLKDPEVAKLPVVQQELEPVQWLERTIQVDFPMGPSFLRISASGDNDDELASIVKATARIYIEEMGDEDRKSRQTQYENVQNLYSKFRKSIEENQQRFRDLAVKVGTTKSANLAIIQKLTLDIIAEKEKELKELMPKVRDAKAKLNTEMLKESWLWRSESAAAFALLPADQSPVNLLYSALLLEEGTTFSEIGKHYYASIIDDALVAKLVQADPKVREYQNSIDLLEKRIRDLERVGVDKSTRLAVEKGKKELAALQRESENYTRQLRPQFEAKLLEEARRKSKEKMAQLRLEFESLHHLYEMLYKELTERTEESRNQTASTISLGWLEAQIEQDEKLLREVTSRRTALEVEKDAPARLNLWEDVIVYRGEQSVRQYLTAGVAGFGAFGLVLFGLAWLEHRKHKLDSPDELAHKLGIRVVGTLPDFSYQRKRAILGRGGSANENWETMFADSVDAIRTLLLHVASANQFKVIMVTSALPGEGKTSASAHLAASLARAERKTLLLDADIRKPSLHELFEMPRGPGISDVLSGQASVESCILPSHIPNLDVIPAGNGSHAAIAALAQGQFARILNFLRERYAFIIVDSSPILHVPDALVVGQDVDAAVFAILQGVSQLPKVYAAYQKLAMLNCRILGAIVNGARDDIYSQKSKYLYYALTDNAQPEGEQ